MPCINTAQTNNNINFQSKYHSETGENIWVQSQQISIYTRENKPVQSLKCHSDTGEI